MRQEHQFPAAEADDHVFDFPPTCLCCPIIVTQGLNDVPGSPFVMAVRVCHTSFTQADFPVQPEHLL